MNRFKPIVLIVALLLTSTAARPAERTSRAIPDGIKDYVNDQTFVVVHVDTTAADPPAIKSFLLNAAKSSSLDKGEADELSTLLRSNLQKMDRWVADFKAAGGREMYALVTTRSPEKGEAPLLIVPLQKEDGKPADAEAIAGLLRTGDPKSSAKQTDSGPRAAAVRITDKALLFSESQTLDAYTGLKPSPRPDLAKVLAAIEPGTVQVALVPTDEVRRVAISALPQLPDAIGGGSGALITEGVRWAVLSLSLPPHPSLHRLIQTKDAESAKALAELYAKVVKLAQGNADFAPGAALLVSLTPKVSGDQLLLDLDANQFSAAVAQFMPAYQKAHRQADRILSMSNIRQIVVGMTIYANENQGKLPDSIDAIIKAGFLGDKTNPAYTTLFVNPRLPGRTPGYIYIKVADTMPAVKDPSRTVVLYEAFDDWKDGIDVGFADGHVEFMADKAEFDKLLKR